MTAERALRPGWTLGAYDRALGGLSAHAWAAIDTLVWRAIVFPVLVYHRSWLIFAVALATATNLIAHAAARRAAIEEQRR